MSVSVLLKLLNELRKREKLQAFGFSETNLIIQQYRSKNIRLYISNIDTNS